MTAVVLALNCRQPRIDCEIQALLIDYSPAVHEKAIEHANKLIAEKRDVRSAISTAALHAKLNFPMLGEVDGAA